MIFDFSYPDIISQCNSIAYLNVMSFCLLSGCGNIEMPNDHELSIIYKLLKNTEDSKMPKNITFLSSLYKRALPVYEKIPESFYDFREFRWNSKKVNKEISVNILSYSICCMTALIPIILSNDFKLENKEFISYCLGINSIKQANFLIDFLRLDDFYYNGKDIGDNPYGEYKILINTENPSLKTQFLAAEALSSVLKLINSNSIYDCYPISKYEKGMALIPIICDNVMDSINRISSRELSTICLSLFSIYNNTTLFSKEVYNTLNCIALELCERVQSGGDIARSSDDTENSSFNTLCKCLNCLVRLHEINSLNEYERSYMKLYDRIDSYWDNNIGLFITTSKNKQRFSIKDICCILSALKAFRNAQTDPDLFMHSDRQLSAFYSSAVINSKIFNNQFYPILQHEKTELPGIGTADKNTAPVFSKFFQIKINKRKYYCEPDVFQAEYVLLGCKYLLL